MSDLAGHLSVYLEAEIKTVTDAVMKLIEEDAPKNKFSIYTGKLRAFEDVKAEIEKFVTLSRAS